LLIRENSSEEASLAVWAFPVKLTPFRVARDSGIAVC
jgi:hypothetical protein